MRKRQLQISVLNIVLEPPHSQERYIELFRSAYGLRKRVKLRGDWTALIGSFKKNDTGDAIYVSGQIFKFFDLDLNAGWFNIKLQEPAKDEEIQEIVIPEDLRPHFQVLDYVFIPKHHRMAVIVSDGGHGISIRQVHKLMTELFNSPSIADRFGRVDVTIEPSREVLSDILGMAKLQRLRIIVTPPNPDDFQEAENNLYRRLNGQNVATLTTELSSDQRTGITPDDDTAVLARIAQSNGVVMGHGKNEAGVTVDISTKDHPLVEKIKYSPALQLRSEVLLQKLIDIIRNYL